MTFMPSFSVCVIAIGVLALLGLADWYVSRFSVASMPAGKDRPDNFREHNLDAAGDQLKKVA